MRHLKGQYPNFHIPALFHTHLDHKHLCHLEIIQSTQPLLSKTKKAEHSIFEVILPLPLGTQNTSTKTFFQQSNTIKE